MTATFDQFVNAYMACALWATNDESTPQGGNPLDDNYGPEDFSPETLAQMRADCEKFFEANDTDLMTYDGQEGTAAQLGGNDFWLSRNGHGAGFFDRDELPEESRERLQEAARRFGGVWLYVGDDNKIYGG